MKNKTIALSLAVLISLSGVSNIMAEEVVVTTTETPVVITTDITTTEVPVISTTDVIPTTPVVVVTPDTTLEGVVIEEPKSVPTTLGLFWGDLRDSLRLAFTFNEIDKANLELKISEEKMKMVEYVTKNVTDTVRSAKIVEQLTKKADKLVSNLEKKQDRILKSEDKRKEVLLKNIAKQQEINSNRLEKLEGKISEEKLNEMKSRTEERNKKLQEKVLNNPNMSQETKDSVNAATQKIDENKASRIELLNKEKELRERVQEGDEAAKEELETLKEENKGNIKESIKENQEIRKETKENIKEEIKENKEERKEERQNRK